MPSTPSRQTILDRFRAKVASGRPIVGGGAGTGLSAKCAEAGGIDLIIIYNSGRFRMVGRGSLAGMMPHGGGKGSRTGGRRGGEEGRTRWSPYHKNKTTHSLLAII